MRLLMIATEYPPAQGYGLARYASELAAALARAGHETHVITCNYGEGRPAHHREGVTVHDMRERLPVRHFDWVGDAVLDNLRLVERALEATDEHGPIHAIISHDWLAAHASKALRAILGVPWLLVVHDTEVGKRGNRLDRRQVYIAEMEGWAIGEAHRVVTNSDFMGAEIARIHKAPEQKIAVVPCGVNPDRFLSDTNTRDFRRLFVQDHEKLVVYAGRLSPMKGVEDLAEAFCLLAASEPRASLVLAGEGVLREALDKRFQEAGVADRVLLTGWVADKVLGALFMAADVVAVPSRYEPFGMVAIEAAACGAAVVAAEVGGLAEVVRGSRGSLQGVPPAQPDLLASALGALLTDEPRTRRMRESAETYARQTYSWGAVAGEFESLLRQMVAGSPGARPVPTV